uniref:Chromosome 16 open reading frame 86 n=1 Tax=Sciurus vulgaris TaxID=55149 RepID=A0A8D2DSK3_SCIVU
MASIGAERKPEAQEGTVAGLTQVLECPMMGDQCPMPVYEACSTQGEDACPTGHCTEPELQEEGIKLEEEVLEAEAGEERGPRPGASIVGPSHGLKRKPIKTEAELPPGMLLQREELEGSQSEPSPSAKQHKKAKKRKSLGAPMLPTIASTVSAPPETLGLEPPVLPRVLTGKAQRLRPLYQYINYCNPELNQAGEEDREAEVEPESELALVPEEAGVEQLQALLPVAGELGLGLSLPYSNVLVSPTHALAPLGEEVGVELGGLPSLAVSGHLKAEVDKSTQVDIDKMLSVCTAPLVPPLSPQYK